MYKSLMFTLLFLLAAVAGCGREDPAAGGPNPTVLNTALWEDGELQQVTVSRSRAFAKVNPAVFAAFTESEDLKVFAEALRTGERIMGILDIRKPDYDMTLSAGSSQQSFHLWIDPRLDSGVFMDVSNTNTGYKLTEESCKQLKKLIAGVQYSSELASSNGDVVNLHGKLINLDRWDRFAANVKSGTRDELQITSYTIEGDPIFQDLIFDGERIEYTYDNTLDAFGSPEKQTSFCKSVEEQKTERGITYTLEGCDPNNVNRHLFDIGK